MGRVLEVAPLNPLQLMSASAISRCTGIDRHTVAEAMTQWEASHGRCGLRFVRIGVQRRACAKSVQSWYDQMERISASGF